MFKYVLAAVWATLIIMKLAEVPAIMAISWWIIAPLPIYVALCIMAGLAIIFGLAYFGLSGYQKKLEKKPFKYPRG